MFNLKRKNPNYRNPETITMRSKKRKKYDRLCN